jgi:hypothetical protein
MNSHLGDRVLPEILYHYTSQAGLIGILSTKTIWASKIHYLNDSKEFALALDLADHELTKRISAATSQGDRSRLELLRDTIYTMAGVNTCVCCFSELGDALSQWRGYGGGNAGFSVGFTREWFTRVKETLGLSLSPCIYDPQIQQRLIQDAIDEFLQPTRRRSRTIGTAIAAAWIQVRRALSWYCGMQGMISQLV